MPSHILAGDKAVFAIESEITHAYERLSFRGLGYFVIHVAGQRYGVCAPDATMLACSLDEVRRRLIERGSHTAPFAGEVGAGEIADAYRHAIYAPAQERKRFFGLPHDEFCDLFSSHHLVWAPDGDEAFDDGSYILQFDVGDKVRLLGYRIFADGYNHDPGTLSEVWLDAVSFYGTLHDWEAHFTTEWLAAPKNGEV